MERDGDAKGLSAHMHMRVCAHACGRVLTRVWSCLCVVMFVCAHPCGCVITLVGVCSCGCVLTLVAVCSCL